MSLKNIGQDLDDKKPSMGTINIGGGKSRFTQPYKLQLTGRAELHNPNGMVKACSTANPEPRGWSGQMKCTCPLFLDCRDIVSVRPKLKNC